MISRAKALPARFELKNPADEAERRAALADWIAAPENILTWRSIVNRVWHYHFGQGLCNTPSDIGRMGGVPSHPELIDWLAVWYRDEARGSLKALHRLILTSATYRQTSAHRPEAAAVDGENRLLWRQNVHRLDAGAYRDYTRAAAGTLNLAMGGPSIQHFIQGPGPQLTPTLDYKAYDWSSEGADRRSIYSFVWRGILCLVAPGPGALQRPVCAAPCGCHGEAAGLGSAGSGWPDRAGRATALVSRTG